jgi:hypothetical protein
LDINYGCLDRLNINTPFSTEPPVLSGTCYKRCLAPGWLTDVVDSIWKLPKSSFGYGRGNGATQCSCEKDCFASNTCCNDYVLACGYQHRTNGFGLPAVPANP